MTNAVVTFQGILGKAIKTPKGTVVGSRLTFEDVPASQLRKDLRAGGLTGNKLTAVVNDVLTGAKDVAWVRHDAAISLLRSQGYVPDHVEVRKHQVTARFVKPTVPAAKAALGDDGGAIGNTKV